ncbi:unannotated protein [freshwater metagenome]|uniref:Unannotated protein n=1 Tax=freshwater metagenome TaxID=449393 RepID=A0A6J6VI07_9ZZZZ
MDLEARGVVILQVRLDFGDELSVVRPIFVEPEHRGCAGGASPIDGEAHPVADREVFCLAGPEDVAGFDVLLEQHVARIIDDTDRARRRSFEGLVVRAILLGGLRHEADVRYRPHRGRVVRAVGLAVVDHDLVDAGVGAIGQHSLTVLLLALGVPHLPRRTDHGGHRRVDDGVARDVEVGDTAIGVDHGERRAIGQALGDGILDELALLGGKGLCDLQHRAETVVRVDARRLEQRAVLGEKLREEGADHMAEDDRVGDLHHGGLEVHREQHARGLGDSDLFGDKRRECLDAHDRGVDDLARQEGRSLLQHRDRAGGGDVFDAERGVGRDRDRLLVAVEVTFAHGRDVGLGVG